MSPPIVSPTSQRNASLLEAAAKEISTVINEAIEYAHKPQHIPQQLRRHAAAVVEETQMLLEYKPFPENQKETIEELLREGRRIKRAMDKAAIDLESYLDTQETSKKQQQQQPQPTGIKVAPLKLPTFAGEHGKFNLFYRAYKENILNNPAITETGKWVHLKEALQGRPLQLIAEIPQEPETLRTALDILNEVYGDADHIIADLHNKLATMQRAQLNTVSLRDVQSHLEGILLSLESLGQSIAQDRHIRTIVLSKFPSEIVYKLVKKKDSTLKEIREKLKTIVAGRESADQQATTAWGAVTAQGREQRPPAQVRPANATQRERSQKSQPNGPPKCLFCDNKHWADECNQYVTAETRKRKIPGRCYKCLRLSHPGTNCIRERRCVYCDQLTHNRALCPTKFPELATQTTSLCMQHAEEKNKVQTGTYLTMLVTASTGEPETKKQIRVVIDTAGGKTLLSKNAKEKLQLKQKKIRAVNLGGLGDTQIAERRDTATTVTLHTPQQQQLDVTAIIVDSIAQDLPAADIAQFRATYPQYAQIPIPPTGQGQPIDMLIANDTLLQIATLSKSIEVNENTQLFATIFGWVIMTRHEENDLQKQSTLLIRNEEAIKQMYDLEIIGLEEATLTDTEAEEKAIREFYRNVKYQEGRYSVDWPWQNYPPNLSNNYGIAIGRLRSMWRKLQTNIELLQQYHAIIVAQEESGIIEKVPHKPDNPHIINYLPHHPIITLEKSTQVRPVLDASTKMTKGGKSLNENMLKGKKWLNDLVEVLLRFRRYDTVVLADIAKAFHQIGVNVEGRDAVRFLWLKDPMLPPNQENIITYRFCRVAFGIISSPFLLHAVITHHLTQKNNEYENTIRTDLYADNLVASLPETIEVERFYAEQKQFFSSMSMNLTKWATNNTNLQKIILEEDRQLEEIQAVLGLQWNRITDIMQIKKPKQPIMNMTTITKRTVLKQMASIFDPLGWATPITLLAKIFVRKLWTEGSAWDKELTEPLKIEWLQILEQIKNADKVALPRKMFQKIKLEQASTIQLHTFVDASMAAYALTMYIVAKDKDESEATFVAAKSRLAPKNKISIPRLELLAILTGARFTNFVKQALQVDAQIHTYVWSDSKCALAWICSNRILPAAVEKQVDRIKQNKIKQFKYVPAAGNKADVASRGATYERLYQEKWWTPPIWINEEKEWPNSETITEEENMQAITLLLNEKAEQNNSPETVKDKEGLATIKIKNFSTLSALLRRTAYVIAATNKILKKEIIKTQTRYDYAVAMRLWIRWDQSKEYSTPLLQRHRSMRLVLSEDGLIHCITRITQAHLPEISIQPILLVKNSHLTELIILQLHRNNNHAGVSHTLASLRAQYWLPQARRQIFKVINQQCYKCRRFTAQTYANPPPAPLPHFRIEKNTRPFQSVGIDIFGPYLVRTQQQKNAIKMKRWVLIFVCAVIRAVHLEVINDMTVDEILMAIRRFIARRGTPQLILCDNAPQFHAIERRLLNIWPTVTESRQVSQYFASKQITFKYVPQHSPWMGGMYERIIKTVKDTFEKTYTNLVMHSRQFKTSIVEIEAVLNCRTISYVDAQADSTIITPNDFLSAKFPAIDISNKLDNDEDIISRLWKASQRHIEAFWEHWSSAYLLALRDRNDQLQKKRLNAKIPPKTGDIVLVAEPQKKRSSWQIAVIERLVHSSDGQIRSAQIRLPNRSRTIRPIIKKAPIGLHCDLPGISDIQLNAARDAIIHNVESNQQEQSNQTNQNIDEVVILGPQDLQT